MPRKKRAGGGGAEEAGAGVTSISYPARRKNIPPAGIEAHGVVRDAPAVRYAFNPHLPPVLRSSPEPTTTDRLPELLAAARQRPLTAEEADELAEALRRHEPWLEWSGKREKPWFEVEPVALHMHERVSTQAILRVLARQDVQRNLFADPQLDYAKAVQFYRHDVDWANRMIGDENLHRVRCVMDEVFGVENFCASIGYQKTGGFATDLLQRNFDYIIWYAREKSKAKFLKLFTATEPTTDDATFFDAIDKTSGEVELVTASKAGRITELGPEERLFARNPCISDGYLETLGYDFRFEGASYTPPPTAHWKTTREGMERLQSAGRLIRKGNTVRFRRYWKDHPASAIGINWTDTGTGGFVGDEKTYVVQTDSRAVERCMLMTTDPGDLVLDPTCGSGTTAYVAEQWGRRWMAIDTSRVALALAKHRLMTARFDYYRLRDLNAEDVARNPDGTWIAEVDGDGAPTGKRLTFDCRTVPHVTLRSIARNTSLDPIFARHEPILGDALATLNRAVDSVDAGLKELLVGKLVAKYREEGANAVTDADVRRWLLPGADPAWIKPVAARKPLKGLTPRQAARYRDRIPPGAWRAWEVPFDTDPDWPQPLQEALDAYRAAWRAKRDDVDACIAANAETEELVDKPAVVSGTVRVAGPFTMEGVIAREEGPDSPIGGAPDELETFEPEDAGELAVADAEAHLDSIIRLLRTSGVDFSDNRNVRFSRLEPVTGAALVHAEGEWPNGNGDDRRVAVSIGPEVGNVTGMQVEDVIRDANRKGYDDVVFAGFGFDSAAQEAIDEASHPRLRLHMALISPDVAMGELLEDQPGSQLFRVFSAPRVTGPALQDDGDYVVEVEGMDVYDPVSNALYPSDRTRIAAWFVDTDYDGRTFCICQAFFPDKAKWDKLARALGKAGAVDPDAFDALSGFRSLPFPRPARLGDGEMWKVAVKIIDPRGNEGLRVLTEGGRWA